MISIDIRSGDVIKISEVVRDLAHRDRENSLTEADLRLYRQAQELLAGELSLSQGTEVEAARDQIKLVMDAAHADDTELQPD